MPIDVVEHIVEELYWIHVEVVLSPTTFTPKNWAKFPSLLPAGKADMQACSLVSSLWTEAAQQRLFRSIVIRDTTSLQPFVSMFSPPLGAHMRHISIELRPRKGSLSAPDGTPESRHHITDNDQDAVVAILELCPKVIRLDLSLLDYPPASANLVSGVLRCQSLRELVLNGSNAGPLTMTPWLSRSVEKLHMRVSFAQFDASPAFDITFWRCGQIGHGVLPIRQGSLHIPLLSEEDITYGRRCLTLK
jgi:hypothetical protein